MEDNKGLTLKEKIAGEMKTDYYSVLENCFDIAKTLFNILDNGAIDVIHRDSLSIPDQLVVYLIGKAYAKEGGLSEFADAGNKELLKELSLSEGSLLPSIKRLRDKKQIMTLRRNGYTFHNVPLRNIDSILKEIAKKVKL